MNEDKTVVIALSGGVDSSVAAVLLVRAGYRVIGMMLRLWSEPGTEDSNRCCTPDAMRQARSVAGQLDIPFYPVDVRTPFRETVVEYFLEGYQRGRTPNPCLVCNRQIRWGILREHAFALGADYMATGHYARLRTDGDGSTQLLRASDRTKDQSYILSGLDQDQLSRSLFPIGGYTKSQVRQLAAEFDLPVAQRPDSQDLCFVTAGDYRDFIRRNSQEPIQTGPIRNAAGEQIGEHRGLENYTIGQRKGLGVSAPRPLYVIDKIPGQNLLVVGEKSDLEKRRLTARSASWIASQPPERPFEAAIQVRYRAREVPALITPLAGDRFTADFTQPVLDITPGQLAAIYREDTCLGGGIIEAGFA